MTSGTTTKRLSSLPQKNPQCRTTCDDDTNSAFQDTPDDDLSRVGDDGDGDGAGNGGDDGYSAEGKDDTESPELATRDFDFS